MAGHPGRDRGIGKTDQSTDHLAAELPRISDQHRRGHAQSTPDLTAQDIVGESMVGQEPGQAPPWASRASIQATSVSVERSSASRSAARR